MGLTVPIHRTEVSHLGSAIESVVVDRVRPGRVLVFITRPLDVADDRSASEARGRDYSVRHRPTAFAVPLSAVLTVRISVKSHKLSLSLLTYGTELSGLVERAEANSLDSESRIGSLDG